MSLRKLLRDQLAGWQRDLPSSWQAAVERVELDFESRAFDGAASRSEIIIPGRKRSQPPEAQHGAHVFHAFDSIAPEGVRAVILGQDPYPKLSWATGHAFEQGNLQEWPENRRLIAASLRRIVQVLANARTGRKAYARGDAGWQNLMRDLTDGKLNLESPRRLFDHLCDEGVLLLNTSLTVGVESSGTNRRAPRGHFQLWRPFIQRVLLCVASRTDQYAVFLLWGRNACEMVEQTGMRATAERIKTWGTQVTAISHPHPAAISSQGAIFLRSPNPFLAANRVLRKLGAEPIRW